MILVFVIIINKTFIIMLREENQQRSLMLLSVSLDSTNVILAKKFN